MISLNRSTFVPQRSFVTQSFNTGMILPPKPSGQTGATPPTGIESPFMKFLVQRKVDAFMKTNPTPCAPISDPELFPSINVTPKGIMGVNFNAYDVNGELMVCVSRATNNPFEVGTWYDAGKMPAMNM